MQIFENPIDFAQIGKNRFENQNRTIFKFGECKYKGYTYQSFYYLPQVVIDMKLIRYHLQAPVFFGTSNYLSTIA